MIKISTKDDVVRAVNEYGIVPFFKNSIRGFSIEENVDPKIWFTSEVGPWEWKGPLIRENGFAYGKFFENKAAYVRGDVFLELLNYRRDGYDFDARFDDGLASFKEQDLYNVVSSLAPALSKTIKEKGNYGADGKKGFDTLICRLQSLCYVTISDFVYETDKNGKKYGWGVAEYSTPERFFGEDAVVNAYKKDPARSKEELIKILKHAAPDASEVQIRKFLK